MEKANSKIDKADTRISKKDKKAQATVPILIIAIGIFLVIYLYSLPLSEKCEILPDLQECKTAIAETKEVTTLVSESPGFIVPQEKYAIYAIRPIKILNQEEIEIATIVENVNVSKDWFYSYSKKGAFSVREKSKEVKIFLYISEARGKLKVEINPRVSYIFEGKGVKKIKVPSSLLDKLNIIRLSTSMPLTPFAQNRYVIDKVIVKEVYSLTDRIAERSIVIKQNLTDLEAATLLFKPDCLTKEKLTIELNNKLVKKDTLCEEKLIDITSLIEKNNSLVFSSDGNYIINPVRIDLKFAHAEYPIYYFDIEEYQAIKKGTALAMLRLEFDSSEEKTLTAYINQRGLNIQTSQLEYKTRINNYLIEGQNRIQLIPETAIKIKSIMLYLE